MDQKQLIQTYFNCWINRDFSKISDYFHSTIIYRECTGAVYTELTEIEQWINEMLNIQTVLNWKIERILEVSPKNFVVEWFFHAKEQEEYCFDGVSLIEFCEGKISKISEYERKHETYRPFQTVDTPK